jgi:PBP1b-binding outer membrane lipoprotein LpoB
MRKVIVLMTILLLCVAFIVGCSSQFTTAPAATTNAAPPTTAATTVPTTPVSAPTTAPINTTTHLMGKSFKCRRLTGTVIWQ